MLRLRAAAWEDGYGVVEDGGALFLVRPPYRKANKVALPESDLEAAVSKQGFTATDQTFASWAALIEHLRRRFLDERKGQVPDSARIKKLVERAPADVVASYLDRIEGELLPRRQWRTANGVLAHLLRNPAVRQDTNLLDRISALLERTELGGDVDAPPLEKEFPLVEELYGRAALELGNRIRREGQVLPMGSAA